MIAIRSWICLILLFIVITISTARGQQFGGGGSGRKTGTSSRDACAKVTLKNGKIKLRNNGRVVKFSCNREYVLVGESTSTCLQGEWTSESPVCATKGCPTIPSPPSGRFISSNGGAVLRLECNPGYIPSSSPMIYCVDRFDWNGTAPLCQASGVRQSAMRCDFESDDLCGWVQDTTTDEFDWTWQNYGTPSSHLSTGPSFDHTLGQGKNGHYLFIESSSPRVPNDTARLFSPVYGAPDASSIVEGVCFAFWFHMFGSTTGNLNVYIKPESKKLTELRPSWSRSGNQGNQWRQGYIPLDSVKENFQVVIEGVRGSGYVGDSAIDDIQLTKGEECLAALGRMMADTVVPGSKTNEEPTSTIAPNATCSSRCSAAPLEAAGSNATDDWACGCSDDCLLKNSCCLDYAAYCLTGRNGSVTIPSGRTNAAIQTATTGTTWSTDTPTTTSSSSVMKKDNETATTITLPSSTISNSGWSSTSTRLMTSSSRTLPFIVSSSTVAMNSDDASTWKMTSTTATSLSTTMASRPTNVPPPTERTAATATTFSTAKSEPATIKSSTSTTTTTTAASPISTSSRMSEKTTVAASSTTPVVIIPIGTTTATTTTKRTTTRAASSSSTPSTARTTTSSQPITSRTTTMAKMTSVVTNPTSRPPTTPPTTPTTTPTLAPSTRTIALVTTLTSTSAVASSITAGLLVNSDAQDGLQGDDQSRLPNRTPTSNGPTPTSRWLIGAAAAGAIGVLLSVIGVSLLVVRARRMKVGGGRPKTRQQNQLAEDSDVRYLRDEDDIQLDLTEATPSPQGGASAQQERTRQFADFERL